MKARYTSYITFLTVLLLFLLPFTSHAGREVKREEEKTYSMEPGGTVKIIANEGYVTISAWDRSKVVLTMTKYARGKSKREAQHRLEEIDVEIKQSADRLTIREWIPDDRSYSLFDLFDPDTWSELSNRITWVDFDLTVPRETHLIITTDEGDVTISETEGDVDVDTDEGRLEIRRIRTDRLSISMDEGDILLERIQPLGSTSSSRLMVDIDEGDVELYEVEIERIEIESDEGDVMAEMIRCQRLDFYSDEGDIEAELNVARDGDYRCRTDEGEIVLLLAHDASFNITAHSHDGGIRSDFPLKIEEVGDGERVDDVVGGGDADLYLFTDEGEIRLLKR